VIEESARQGVNWRVWRLVFAPQIPDGLTQIRRWPFRDVLEAHQALDAINEITDIERERQD